MKLNIKRKNVIIWGIVIIAIIILPDAGMYYQQFKLSRSEKLPEKYQSYTTLDSLKDNEYEVLKIKGSGQPVIQMNDSTIVICITRYNESKDESYDVENTWYKINLKGQIIDSLQYKFNDGKQFHNYQTFNDYIVDVDQNTYCNWLKDGNPTHYPYKNISEGKIFSMAEADEILKDKEYMYDEIIHSKTVENDYKNKLTVYKDGTWNYFDVEEQWYGIRTYIINKKKISYENSTYDIDTKSGPIKREHFQKERWNGRTFWSIKTFSWGTGNGSGSEGWSGTSYFSIKMPKKLLHYKDNVFIEYPNQHMRDPNAYFTYQPKNGEYLLLINEESQMYYLIRPKNRKQ